MQCFSIPSSATARTLPAALLSDIGSIHSIKLVFFDKDKVLLGIAPDTVLNTLTEHQVSMTAVGLWIASV